MDSTAVDAILRLGLQLKSTGRLAEAAKCFLAVCRSNALPAVTATARLLLGQLLLYHTHDIVQAKEHLTAAELILRSSPGNHLLRCETLDTLARCYQHLGALPQQRETYASGLGICREGAHSKDREALVRWAVYFHFRLAEHSLLQDSAADALHALRDVMALQGLTVVEQALHLLSRAFLHLHLNRYDAATADLKDCHTLLDGLPQQQLLLGVLARQQQLLESLTQQQLQQQEQLSLDSLAQQQQQLLVDSLPRQQQASVLEAAQLRAHLLVLGISLSLARGNLKELDPDSRHSASMLRQLQQLVDLLGDREWAYSWMPSAQVQAVAALLHATALRGLGRVTKVAPHLERAEECVDRQLRELKFQLQGTEGVLDPHTVWAGKGYALLKLLVLQQHALIALTSSDFAAAAQHIGSLIGVMQRFPTLMHDFVPSVNMLQGFYAHSVGEYAAGIAHFKAVMACESCIHLHPMAAATAALCELKRDSSQAGVGRAVELLEVTTAPGSGCSTDSASGRESVAWSDKALSQLLVSLVALRQGDTATAKVQLARTLKLSHSTIGNSQLVGVVLVALAPVQLDKGDTSGAGALLDSAFTILKGINDLPSILAALDAMALLAERQGDAERLAKNREYARRKAADLQVVMEKARATEAHQLVLHWAAPKEQ